MNHEQEKEPREEATPRRRFLSGVTMIGLAGLAAALDDRKSPSARGPRELPLREADFYKPHTLAG